jgi:hypothetical protein
MSDTPEAAESPVWAALTDGTQWHVKDYDFVSEIKPGEPGWRDIPRYQVATD